LLPQIKRKQGRKLDIITATRDPIGREISVYFQNFTSPNFPLGISSQEEAFKIGAPGLIERFHQRWESGAIDTTIWFDRHFKSSLGLNIYDFPFDAEKGWQIIETDLLRILIVRFEDINRNYLEAVNSFVALSHGGGIRYDKMIPANVSDKKWYGSLMKDFRQQITFKKEILDSAYNSKYCSHFYTSSEIDKMRSKHHVEIV
jgi:hypothetical protein